MITSCLRCLRLVFLGFTAWGLAIACLAASNPTTAPIPRPYLDRQKILPENDAHPPLLHSDQWQPPVPVPGAVNSAGAEDSPFITPDGSTLYFFFTPDPNIPPEKQLLDRVTGIYQARLQAGEWKEIERLVLNHPGELSLDGCLFTQDDVLWFCSAREGHTGVNLFTARWIGGRWQDWKYAGDLLNRDYQVGEMHLTADGLEMYFHADRPGGAGALDIWVTRMFNGQWQPPQNVAMVNSPASEGWPYLNPAGDELWFTRTVQGTPAILRSRKLEGQWTLPEIIVSQFAGEPTLDSMGNLYFVHHYFIEGKMLEADIYVSYKR